MKNKFWLAIHEVYTKLESHCGQPKAAHVSGNVAMEEAGNREGGQDMAELEDPGGAEDLVAIRSDLRTQLDFLRATLSEQYSERDTYLILFPVVAQIDEIVLGHFLSKLNTGWPSLQKELFQIDNAGEVFFDILDDILLKPQTAQFIYEVYYFCLSYGFRGRYQDNPVKIQTYMKKLSGKLELEELETILPGTEDSDVVSYQGSMYMGYLVSAAVLVGIYLFFTIAGRNVL